MMKIFYLTLLLSSAVFAETFKMAGTIYEFKSQDGLLVKGCEKGCDALKKVKLHKKIDLQSVRKTLNKANSIGSDVCAYVYQGKTVLGLAENKDQRAFCLFPDKSMIELNSLGTYLTRNKIISE